MNIRKTAPRPLRHSTSGILVELLVIGGIAAGMAAVGLTGMFVSMAETMGGDCNAAYRGEEVEDANGCMDNFGEAMEQGKEWGEVVGAGSPIPDAESIITGVAGDVFTTIAVEGSKPTPSSSAPLPGGPAVDDDDDTIIDDDDIVNDDDTGDDDDIISGSLCERTVANLDRCGLLTGAGALPADPDDAVVACEWLTTEHPLAGELRCNFECMLGFPDCADQTDPQIIDLCDEDCSQ